ncbi:hypothetical protein BD769DRAFT_1689849 [Suillus cothurnatus]|nr:hypothetical protein BD769DRAFT_1689849 [Suillus cothurnatus]
MPNQWKPTCTSAVLMFWIDTPNSHPTRIRLAPLDIIEPHIHRLWKACQTDKQIVAELQKHFDTSCYGLGLTKFLKVREAMGLRRTRQQNHNVETIRNAMTNLRPMYPNAGAREVVSLLFHEWNMSVPRSVVISYFRTYEPELVRQLDQHDKWLRYGLGLHTGIEPFSGRIMWMRVWHSNRNPQLILSYYLDTVEMLGHMPMVTQSDPGSENYGIANGHTMLRQWHDPALQGSLQHRWMRSKKNVMPEITWSQMRRHFTPGFETLLDRGVTSGWYDTNNTLQLMIFHWVFIPWLQRELDAYQDRILPHGAPNIIYQSPENFGVLDFKIKVECEALDHVRELYIDPSHVVFDLVPQPFKLGRPLVTRDSAWDVYLRLLAIVNVNDEMIPRHIELLDEAEEELTALPLIENLQELPYSEDGNGGYYMGGVGGGLGLVDEHLHQLESLARDDEPDITLGIDEDVVGLDDAGLVVWDFSDSDNSDVLDECRLFLISDSGVRGPAEGMAVFSNFSLKFEHECPAFHRAQLQLEGSSCHLLS